MAEQIDALIFEATVHGLGTLSLAVCTGGDYLILRDGRPLEGYRWPAADSAKAVAAFRLILTTDFAEPAQAKPPQEQEIR